MNSIDSISSFHDNVVKIEFIMFIQFPKCADSKCSIHLQTNSDESDESKNKVKQSSRKLFVTTSPKTISISLLYSLCRKIPKARQNFY